MRLFETGRARGWTVIRWITAEDNYRARSAYDRISDRTQWITYEIKITCAPDSFAADLSKNFVERCEKQVGVVFREDQRRPDLEDVRGTSRGADEHVAARAAR